MIDYTIEFITCFKYHIRSFLFFNVFLPIGSKVVPLPDILPDKDKDLQLVKYSSVVDTGKEVNAFLTNKFHDDEGFAYKFLKFIQNFSSNAPKTNYYRLYNPLEVENTFNYYLLSYNKTPTPLYSYNVLRESECIQEGPFFGNLVKENQYLVIDSLHMTKYEYKPDTLVPAVKAFFVLGDTGTIKLEKILYKNEFHYPDSNTFPLAKRLLFNYLLTKTILSVHLVTCHLKISQLTAYGIRKYLSSDNIMKQFLWNFTSGVHGINLNTGILIRKNIGSVSYFLPFSQNGIVDYINDCAAEDCSNYIFPEDQDYPCKTFSECETIFTIYKKYIKKIIKELDKQDLDECIELYNFLRLTIKEFKHKHIEDVLASFMFTASILHENSSNFFQQIVQGYDCPTSIHTDGSIHKYRYLLSIIAQTFVNMPQRKIFISLPETYNASIRKHHDDMCSELLNEEFQIIDIESCDSAVQK